MEKKKIILWEKYMIGEKTATIIAIKDDRYYYLNSEGELESVLIDAISLWPDCHHNPDRHTDQRILKLLIIAFEKRSICADFKGYHYRCGSGNYIADDAIKVLGASEEATKTYMLEVQKALSSLWSKIIM